MHLYLEILQGVNISNGIKIQCPNVVISGAKLLYYFKQDAILNKIFLSVNHCRQFTELFYIETKKLIKLKLMALQTHNVLWAVKSNDSHFLCFILQYTSFLRHKLLHLLYECRNRKGCRMGRKPLRSSRQSLLPMYKHDINQTRNMGQKNKYKIKKKVVCYNKRKCKIKVRKKHLSIM